MSALKKTFEETLAFFTSVPQTGLPSPVLSRTLQFEVQNNAMRVDYYQFGDENSFAHALSVLAKHYPQKEAEKKAGDKT